MIVRLGSWSCDLYDGQVMPRHSKSVYDRGRSCVRLDYYGNMFMTHSWKRENL